MNKIMNYFNYVHLPLALQEVSSPIGSLAIRMDRELEDSEEKSMGLRKLLEAKDCFVRAKIESVRKAEQKKKLGECVAKRQVDTSIVREKDKHVSVPGIYKGGTC